MGSILFNSGVFHSFVFNILSHSFASDIFCTSLSIDIICLIHALNVMMYYSDLLSINRKYVVDINIHGRQLLAKLIVIPIKYFDVILGMN